MTAEQLAEALQAAEVNLFRAEAFFIYQRKGEMLGREYTADGSNDRRRDGKNSAVEIVARYRIGEYVRSDARTVLDNASRSVDEAEKIALAEELKADIKSAEAALKDLQSKLRGVEEQLGSKKS